MTRRIYLFAARHIFSSRGPWRESVTSRASDVIDNQSPVIAIDWSTVATTTTTSAITHATAADADTIVWRCIHLVGGGANSRWQRAELWLVEEHKPTMYYRNTDYEHNAYDFVGAIIKS